jgi:D-cysteine desulfhydrase
MTEYAVQAQQKGSNCYIIPEGGSNATGAWGYVSCFQEIVEQLNRFHMHVDAVVVATGSGGTHAGLLIGKKLLASAIDIISINVCDSADFFKQKLHQIFTEFETKYEVKLGFKDQDIHIVDGFVGAGYGLIYPEIVEIIAKLSRTEGIVLDPVYSAKAFYGLTKMIENREFTGKNILFIHTGGIFGVFPQNAHLQNLQGPASGD